jgi:hypothetical protein
MTKPLVFSDLSRRASIAAIIAALTAPHAAQAAETMTIHLDQARITRFPDRVSTIVIGNPLIADVSLQTGGLAVLTGKGYGVTNVVALDRSGAVLSELLIQVQAASDGVIVVYRGDARESYSCTPTCEPRIALGDTQQYFESVIGQSGARTSRAQSAGSTNAAGGAAGGGAR